MIAEKPYRDVFETRIGHEIVGERAGQKVAVVGVGILFIERRTERLGKAPACLLYTSPSPRD